jgi:multicomponent Na+:H+ antiporter subunit D
MNLWLILPLLIPMLAAVMALLAYRSRLIQRRVSVAGAAALLVAAIGLLIDVEQNGVQSVQIGNWPAPYGITLVADLFSALMVMLAGLLGLLIAIYSLSSIDQLREAFGYHALYHFLLMGVCGAFLTGDLFNLYVWFELMLMASFVLMTLGGERGQMEGAIKYVTINLVASTLFLTALGILYGLAGTLNMADLAYKFANIAAGAPPGILTTLALLFLVAFGIKAAMFPLFFWLPASYHTPPVAVSALFSGLLTKVGVYALIRVFTLIFVQDAAYTHTLILVLAGLTMVTGVLGAVAQYDFRRLLSFHIISQIGYLLMGLGLFSSFALAGAIYFTLHVSIAKAALFLMSGVVRHLTSTFDLKRMGGLYQARPILAVLFLIPALSLAGLPPLSGFFAKLSLVQAGLELQQYVIVGVALGVSLLTLFSMIKIWTEAFWKRAAPSHLIGTDPIPWGQLIPIGLMAAAVLLIGLGAGPIFDLTLTAGEQLMNPAGYIETVLGGMP